MGRLSTATVTTAQDPFVRAYWSLARWHRGRQLVLAAIVGAAVLGLAIERSPPAAPTVISVTPDPVAPERVYKTIITRLSDPSATHILEPAVWAQWDGSLYAHARMRSEEVEMPVDADPAAIELALREWATRICEPEPRPLYLVGFHDDHAVARLNQLFVDACPGFRVNRVRLQCWCGRTGPGHHPHL